jgi:hypothetical protein
MPILLAGERVRGPELALDSALKDHHISNEQGIEVSAQDLGQQQDFDRDYGEVIKRRGAPTPRYNCHGLTFASRRTGVYEDVVVHQILREDGYQEIPPALVLPGDVIVYFGEGGDIEHSGVVLTSPMDSALQIPTVCSKWGKYRELIHPANRCPYTFATAKYFRMR